jgi:hypothetical protein
MTISHPGPFPLLQSSDEAFLFAEFGPFASVCAPNDWTQERVEQWTDVMKPVHDEKFRWCAVDKSKLGLGSPTPNACNHAPEHRKHWFMILEVDGPQFF